MLKRLMAEILNNSEYKWGFVYLCVFWALLLADSFFSFGRPHPVIFALFFLMVFGFFLLVPMSAFALDSAAKHSLTFPWKPIEGVIAVALFPCLVVCWQTSFILGNIDNLLAYFSVQFEFSWSFVFFPAMSYFFTSRDELPSLISWANGNFFLVFLITLFPKTDDAPEGFECNGEFRDNSWSACNGTEIPYSEYITWDEFLYEFYGITQREHDLVNYLCLLFFAILTCVTLICLRAIGLQVQKELKSRFN